jgi:hypothetical protein
MELIDQYVYEVTRRVAKKNRQDISMELRSTIEDMLPDNHSKKEVKEVLQELGDPAHLASQYEDKKQYLIGPLFYDRYIHVLKIVGFPILLLIFLSEWISGIVVSNGNLMLQDSIIQIIKEMFVTLLYSFTQVFFWITFTFVCMERFTKAKEIRSWTPDDLLSTSIPVNKQISKWEVFFSLWTTLWPVVLVNFGWYRFHNGTSVSYPLFNQEILMTYLPAIIGVVVIGVGIVIYKLIKAEWTKPLVGLNAAYHLIFAILLCLMVSNPNLFNQESINVFFRYTEIDPNHWLMIIWGIVGLAIVSSIVDVYLSLKASRLQ